MPFSAITDRSVSISESRRGRRRLMNSPIASGRKLLVEEVAARDGYRPFQRNSAQSPPRFDTATSRPDPPYPGDVQPVPQALESGLQQLELDWIVC